MPSQTGDRHILCLTPASWVGVISIYELLGRRGGRQPADTYYSAPATTIAAHIKSSLISAISRELPRGSTALAIGVPRSSSLHAVAAVRPDICIVPALSEAVLAAHPDFTGSLVESCAAQILVAGHSGVIHVAETRRFAGHALSGGLWALNSTALADITKQLRGLSLLWIGPESGHQELLLGGLRALAEASAVVWWEVPRGDGLLLLRQVAKDPRSSGCTLYGVSQRNGLCRPDAFLQRDDILAIILVPDKEWDCFGLEAMVNSPRQFDYPVPAIVPRSRRIEPALLAALTETLSTPAGRLYLPNSHLALAGEQLFANGARLVRTDFEVALQARQRRHLRLAVMPAAPGSYRVRLLLAKDLTEAAARDMSLDVGPDRVAMLWNSADRSFHSDGAFTIIDSEQPLFVSVRAGLTAFDLSIRGLEWQIEQTFGAGIHHPVTSVEHEGETGRVFR